MGRTKGNPNWGKPEVAPAVPAAPTSFELTVKALRLSPPQYRASSALREWVRKNKNQRYVPPELLSLWGFEVKTEF